MPRNHKLKIAVPWLRLNINMMFTYVLLVYLNACLADDKKRNSASLSTSFEQAYCRSLRVYSYRVKSVNVLFPGSHLPDCNGA